MPGIDQSDLCAWCGHDDGCLCRCPPGEHSRRKPEHDTYPSLCRDPVARALGYTYTSAQCGCGDCDLDFGVVRSDR